MAVANIPNLNCVTVTGLLITQTPESQAPAAAFPFGFSALDVTNGRTFVVHVGVGGVPTWVTTSPFLIPDMKWGNTSATVSAAVQRIYDPAFSARAATATAGGITAANFETLPKLQAQYHCRVNGYRVTRTGVGAPGGMTAIQMFLNGVAIGPAGVLPVATFSLLVTFVAPVSVTAGDRLQMQSLVNTATVQNVILEAIVMPPAG